MTRRAHCFDPDDAAALDPVPARHWIAMIEPREKPADPDISRQSDFRRRSVFGVAQAMTGRLFQVLVTFGSMAVLARILRPADFGIVATVSAISAFLAVFRDAGLAVAAIRSRELTSQQSTNLFWITLAVSCAVALAIAVIAPLVAGVYRMPEITNVMRALALASVLEGIGLQHGALLRRDMRLGVYTTATVLSEALAVAAAIALAMYGWGYWALVAKALVAAATFSAMLWWFCKFRPGRPRRGSGTLPLIAFGGRLTLAQWLWVVLRKADDALIGWAWGPAVLGFYSRAYSLLLLPTQQLTSPLATAAIPTLSRLQDQPDRFRRYYLRGIEFVTFVGFPLVVLLFVAAEDFVLLVFGSQWLPSVPIFRALGPAALIEMTAAATSWIFTPLGRSDKELRMAAIYVPVFVLGVICGLPWGAIGVAIAISVVRIVAQPFNLRYCYLETPLTLRHYYLSIWKAFTAACLAGALTWGIVVYLGSGLSAGFIRLLVAGAIMPILYMAIFAILPGGARKLAELVQTAREMLSSRRSGQA